MINYIRSEFYRILHYKWTYLFIIICSALLLSSNIVLAAVKYSDSRFPYATTDFSLANALTSMGMIYLLCITVSSMIFNHEYRNQTLKNCVSYGYSRATIFFGKLLVQIVYSMIVFVIILGSFILSAYLLLENSGSSSIYQLVRACFACLPLFISGLAITNCFLFMIEGSGAASAAALSVMFALPMVCNMLAMRFDIFAKIYKVLAWSIVNSPSYRFSTGLAITYWDTQQRFINCWIIGITTTVLISMVGFLAFRKKDIK